MINVPVVATATITSGASLSDAVYCGDGVPEALVLPVIDAAAITFQGSADGVTYVDVYDVGASEVSIASSSGSIGVPAPEEVKGYAYIKVRTGTSATPVAQTAQREIQVIIK